jgi:hypothetical protein
LEDGGAYSGARPSRRIAGANFKLLVSVVNTRSAGMFEDSLVESSGTLSKRNSWTAALSFAMQGMLAGGLVLLPRLTV